MANILQNVQTYNDAALGRLTNMMPLVSESNKKFENFQTIKGNLGDTVTFNAPPRMTTTASLRPSFDSVEQLKYTLSVNKKFNTSYAISNSEYIFNLTVEEAMRQFGMSATDEIASQIESDVSSVAVNSTYRTYGAGEAGDLSSYTAIATAIANFKNYGSAKGNLKVFLPDLAVPTIIGNGLGQFTPIKNDKTVNTWQLGSFAGADYFVSNLLPKFQAGVVGQNPSANPITIDAISADGSTIDVTVSTVLSQAKAFKAGDIITVDNNYDATEGNLRFLTWSGHLTSDQKVQVRVTADADTNGTGQTTLSIYPALIGPTAAATYGARNQNINRDIVATMTAKAMKSHVAGLIVSSDALFFAMPKMGNAKPYETGSTMDIETGISLRSYDGYLIRDPRDANADPVYGMVHDGIYGYSAVPQYMMRLAFPLPN